MSFVVVRDDKVENEVYVGATVVVTVVVIYQLDEKGILVVVKINLLRKMKIRVVIMG